MTRVAGLLFVFVACLVFSESARAEKLSLLYSPLTAVMPCYVAKDEGIFEKHGLDVDLVLLTNQGAVISALVAGTAQIGTPSALAVIQANDAGLDTVFVGATATSPSASRTGVFVRNGSAIHGPSDLVGKRMGVPSLNTLIHVVSRRWLKENGIDYTRVTFAEVGFQQMADALVGGIVDAAVVIDPYYERATQIGYTIGNPDETLPNHTLTAVYAATREWTDAHKAAVAAFRQSVIEGTDFIAHNEQKARISLRKYTKLPEAIAATAPLSALDIEIRPAQIQFFIDLAREQGLIASNPDAAHMIAP